jgi:ribosomal protein S17E
MGGWLCPEEFEKPFEKQKRKLERRTWSARKSLKIQMTGYLGVRNGNQ